jgi:hypothetical protein
MDGIVASYDVPFVYEAGALAGAPVCLHVTYHSTCDI